MSRMAAFPTLAEAITVPVAKLTAEAIAQGGSGTRATR